MKLFIDRMLEKIRERRNPTVVGLDPRLDSLPKEILNRHFSGDAARTQEMAAAAILEFNCKTIDVIEKIVPAVKPQIAFYEIFGAPGIRTYFKTIKYAQDKGLLVIGDIKRGDIGSTAEAYVKGHIETAEEEGVETGGGGAADAVTLSPYLGEDSLRPFITSCKKTNSGLFVLVKTSNPSSSDFQDLLCNGEPLYMTVAQKVGSWGSDLVGEYGYSSVGAVVGATHPETIKKVRSRFGSLFMLIPGYGAQGGKIEMIKSAFDQDGNGAIVNSSRGIIFAGQKSDKPWEKAVEEAALEMKFELGRAIGWH